MEDAALLMSFLDHVFPLQFPMYKPGMMEGGRGWLLNLVLRKGPFYHAALALGAYHCRTQIPAEHDRTSRLGAMAQQDKHLGICMHLIDTCPRSDLDVTMAVLELVFFKVWYRACKPSGLLLKTA